MKQKPWYETLFENYGEQYEKESFTQGTKGECDFIEKELNFNKETAILDVGCGTGRHAIELAKRGYPITGNTREQIISRTIDFVQTNLAGAEGGHDWWHIQRVWKLARHIAEKEPGDLFVIELGALLHDIADSKFNNGDEEAGPRKASNFLNSLQVAPKTVAHVEHIIRHVSFKGGNHKPEFQSPELAIVQDADRLDAMGAIGIARTFNYGGFKNREIYNPDIPPNPGMTKEAYQNSTSPTINHFYEKLLLLKDRMNTPTGRALAEQRHRFMEQFLEEFFEEWNGQL